MTVLLCVCVLLFNALWEMSRVWQRMHVIPSPSKLMRMNRLTVYIFLPFNGPEMRIAHLQYIEPTATIAVGVESLFYVMEWGQTKSD